jgi:hypothetical protein
LGDVERTCARFDGLLASVRQCNGNRTTHFDELIRAYQTIGARFCLETRREPSGANGRREIMSSNLANKKVAILATDGFEYVELTEPKKALEATGAKTELISPKDGQIKGWNKTDWGESVSVDRNLKSAKESAYGALVLPGGVMNPDHLRSKRLPKESTNCSTREAHLSLQTMRPENRAHGSVNVWAGFRSAARLVIPST